jgi:hypothetical protein
VLVAVKLFDKKLNLGVFQGETAKKGNPDGKNNCWSV